MAVYINAVRIYLDSAPTVASSSDIGLYAVGGGNSVFRLIESNIAGYTPTYTWKTGILKPAPIAPIQESVDLTDGGNVPTIGGTYVRLVNTLLYGGAMTQLDYILDSNDIRLSGLRGDIIRFEVSAGVLVEADGEIIYRGICGDPVWDERQFKIPLENALLKRKSNLATVINEEDDPDADPDILGQSKPVTFGEFKPEFDVNGNPVWNGYAQFKRVANKEAELRISFITLDEDKTIRIWPQISEIGTEIFPIVGNDGDTPPIMYKIKLSNTIGWFKGDPAVALTKGIYSLDYFEDKYLYVIEGTGNGKYRKISSARVDINTDSTLIELTLADYFEDTLAGNATATAADNSWVTVETISRQYQSDVWKCKGYISSDGDPLTQGIELYSYVEQRTAKVTTENTDATIEEKPISFLRLPEYAYEEGSVNNNLLDIDVNLFGDNPDQMDSFLIKSIINWVIPPDSLAEVNTKWGLGMGYKVTDGYFTIDSTATGALTYKSGDAEKITDHNQNTRIIYRGTHGADLVNVPYWFLYYFDLPEFPLKFQFDNIYLGMNYSIKVITGSPDIDKIYVQSRRFFGATTDVYESSESPSGINRIIDNILDQYYLDRETKNKNFYFNTAYTGTIGGISYRIIPGYSVIDFSTITDESQYKAVKEVCVKTKVNSDSLNEWEYRINQIVVMFRKSISIKKNIFSPFQGRIYNSQWGQAAGSSSSSSSSSSESSPSSSSSSSLSSSSQSSPSSSSSSNSSSSSSSESSPSSSSSSSESCILGVGRKNACDMINNPVDILEHTLRLQNWSEQEETKEWGKEYASVPLIDVAITEGGFDYEDLNPIKALRPARQILRYNDAYTDKISRSICKQFFLCNYQNPSTGNESVSYIADKSLSTPSTLLTLADIVGSIGEVIYPKVKGIYCEPVVRYAKNNANGKYEKVLQITNANKDTFDSSYVIGLSGADAELMWTRAHILWNAYRQVEPAPNDMANCDWIVTDSDAVWYLDTWLTYMGAINTDGTTSGVEFEPKKRIAFSVSYETGKDWFLTQHHRLKLPHQTNDTAIEFLIEKLSKNIVMGKEVVSLQAMLYGEVTDIAMYVQDVYDAGTLLADWQDVYTTQAEVAAQGADVQDIT